VHLTLGCALLLAAASAAPSKQAGSKKSSNKPAAPQVAPAPAPPPMEVTPAPPPVPKEAVKLAVSGISVVGLPAKFGEFYAENAAQELGGWGMRVTTPREVASLLGLERQKQLLGCAEDASNCIAELANALGVDGLLLGDIGKFGNTYQVNLKVIAAANGRVLAAYSERVTSEEMLLDVFSRAAERIAKDVAAATGRPEPKRTSAPVTISRSEAPVTKSTPMRKYSWIPGVVAVGGGVAGALMWSSSRSALNELSQGSDITMARAAELRDSGARSQTLAMVAFGASAVALAGAATMFFWSEDATPPSAVVGVSPSGIAVAGTF
jgi:hypothetical protein